jgi:hypothetical protein
MRSRQFRTAALRHFGRAASAASALALFTGIGATARAQAAPDPVPGAAASAAFTVYDDTFYTNIDLRRIGMARSNLVYEAPVARLAGQDPARFRGARPAGAELALPPRAAYEDLVRRTTFGPGPLVLDFETLYLRRAKPAVAARRFQKLRTLLDWAHDAVPGRPIGYYGVLGNTAPEYLGLERRLAAREDALFPSLYTFGDDLVAWRTGFRRIMAEAAAVAPGKPVYAYLWPQYHGGTRQAGRYLAPAHWNYELETAERLCAGAVVWGPAAADPDVAWVGATEDFLVRSGLTAPAQARPAISLVRNPEHLVLGLAESLVQQPPDVVAAQPVVPGAALGALVDEPGEAELRKMLAGRRRGAAGGLRQRAHAQLAVPQRPQQAQPGGLGQHVEVGDGGLDVGVRQGRPECRAVMTTGAAGAAARRVAGHC